MKEVQRGARNSATGSFIGDHNTGFISRSSASAPARERMDRKGLADKSRWDALFRREDWNIDREADTWEIKRDIKNIRCAVAQKDAKCD